MAVLLRSQCYGLAFSTAARSMAGEPFDKTTNLYRDSVDNAGFTYQSTQQ